MLAAAVILLAMLSVVAVACLCALCAILVAVKRLAAPAAPVTFAPPFVLTHSAENERVVAELVKRATRRGLVT